MSETQVLVQPQRVYVAASYMSPVGKYDGKHLEELSFLELAAQVNQIFETSSIRHDAIE